MTERAEDLQRAGLLRDNEKPEGGRGPGGGVPAAIALLFGSRKLTGILLPELHRSIMGG